MFATLMTTRRFAPLFWCQFFSAFNDNFLKTALVFLILFSLNGSDAEALISLAGAIFIFPFFVLSALGGEIADRFDKARVAERLKRAEIAVAALAVGGFWAQSIAVLFVALFLFGVISALFGPIKYGILPDHLARAELPAANALVEGATFIAILAGTVAGGLAARGGSDRTVFAAIVMAMALLCWISARSIPPTGSAAPRLVIDRNIARSTVALVAALHATPLLWWGGLVISWFWLVGAVALSIMPPLVKATLGADEGVVTAFLAIFSVAIGIGAAIASIVARGRITPRPTLAGAVLIGVFAFDLGFATYAAAPQPGGRDIAAVFGSAIGLRIAVDCAGLAAAGGLFIVPVFSAVQAWAGADRRARVVAAVNILNAAVMAAAGVIVALLQKAGMTPPALFMLIGAAGLAVAAAIARTMPRDVPSSAEPSPQ